MFLDSSGRTEPMTQRSVQPTKLLPWIQEEELAYYVSEFERAGWNGGVNFREKRSKGYSGSQSANTPAFRGRRSDVFYVERRLLRRILCLTAAA